MKILWLDRLISMLDTQSRGIGKWSHPAGSHPFPAGPKRWLPPLYSLLWSHGLTQGLNHHILIFCTWIVMYCVIVKTMISTRWLPTNTETCGIWFTLRARLWRWQLILGLFGRQTHGALQCSCYLSQGQQRAVCSCLWQTLQGDPTSQS